MIDHITGNTTFKIIEIIVTPQGKTTVQTLGFTGASCRDASRFLEQALGERTSEYLTAEFHQAQSSQQQQQHQA
jgi:hypothetical protein